MDNKDWGVTSIACILMVGIYTLGPVSGAHFNPAVTVALLISGALEAKEAGIYIMAQLAAGILAGFSYLFMIGRSFNLGPKKGYGMTEVALAESLYTCMLCFVVLNVACPRIKGNTPNHFYGLAISFVIVAGGYGAGAVSGGAFNPAVAFGIDVSSAHLGFGWCFVYAFFQLCGAAVAVVLHKIVRPTEPGSERLSVLACEFLGTFFLAITVGLNVISKSHAIAWSIAAALMCMIYALGDVSGHFNPAVTLAIYLRGSFPHDFPMALAYMAAQLFGGCAGAAVYPLIMHETFALAPKSGFGWIEAAAAETLFTFVLCFVALAVATTDDPQCRDMFGLAIGGCVTVGGNAIGVISGGWLNPAVSMGISFSDALHGGQSLPDGSSWYDPWEHWVTYSTFEMAGGALAAVFFYGTHQHYFPGPTTPPASDR